MKNVKASISAIRHCGAGRNLLSFVIKYLPGDAELKIDEVKYIRYDAEMFFSIQTYPIYAV